jgi:glutamate-ammonia-ligase adenylyltransferase
MPAPNARPRLSADAAIEHAARLSHYARRALAADPQALTPADVEQPFTAARMREVLEAAAPADEHRLQRALRRLRRAVLLRVIARDLSGRADLAEVVTTASALADIAISFANERLHGWLAAQYGEPRGEASGRVQQLHVVGMGKLGGLELNVSSDIDLIFVYPEEGETDGARPLSNHEFFTRLGRRLIAMVGENTADGFVFRVDMRLRPWGDAGPLACGLDMLENYFYTQGREWERYAWIKARVVCGDRAEELMALARPFVFRRHLDYSAIASLRDLHRQVRQEVARREMHDNIKLGPGGIREVEFLVQLFQLIRGGRDSALQQIPTLDVLPVLEARNLLPATAVAELTEAYIFLRNLEHRLQYLDDQQTQSLPAGPEEQALLAAMAGCADYSALLAELEHQRQAVTRHFEGIFTESESTREDHRCAVLWQDDVDAEVAGTLLGTLGYARPPEVLRQLTALRSSHRIRQMSASSRTRLDRLVPLVTEAAARQQAPDATLAHMLHLLESVSRREAYLALLTEYPQALDALARLMGASPWVAQYLTQHPILLDELLDPRMLHQPPDWPRLAATLRAELDSSPGDTERQMDLLRHFKQAQTIRLVAQDLAGELALETLSDHLTDLADLIVGEVLRLNWLALKSRHRDAPAFAVIGYGKLGGKELGYASDLDLVFLHDDPAAEALEVYSRLAQRMNTWMTSVTPAGLLYETDLRLRPDGAAGLLVSSLAGFDEYQRAKAWVWEHQALTRARFCAGDRDVGARFEAARVEILRTPRDTARLADEIRAMRQKMLDGHPNASGLFDIKHDRGGIIDVEFVVQYLVLGHACRHAELTGNIGNLALLKLAARLNLLDAGLAAAAHDAYRHFRQLQHALRLRGEPYARVPPDEVAGEVAAVRALWEAVLAA